jgi:C_GCAxxG_C_C family probable redox protein
MYLRLSEKNERNPQAEVLILTIGERARHLFETRQLLCAEAVITALNQGLGGGLSDTQAVALAAPFSVSMGESGCLCGALSGALLACGLFLCSDGAFRCRWDTRKRARLLHDCFKTKNGSTCCRVLSRNVRNSKKVRFQRCADLTSQTAILAARLILQKRPELLNVVHKARPPKRESKWPGVVARLMHYFTI